MSEASHDGVTALGRAEAMRLGFALSAAGRVTHGGRVEVPWGTVADWSILVSPAAAGLREPGSEFDNALLAFEVGAAPDGGTGWRVTARYRFRSADSNDPQYVRDYDGEAHYLVVVR